MALITTMVLMFSADEDRAKILRSINRHLAKMEQPPVEPIEMAGRPLETNVYGRSFNYLEHAELLAHLKRVKWKHPRKVCAMFDYERGDSVHVWTPAGPHEWPDWA